MNPSNFYGRSDLSARSFYNSEESLSFEDISIPGSEYLPSEDENDHLSLDTSNDISSSETSSDNAAPIQQGFSIPAGFSATHSRVIRLRRVLTDLPPSGSSIDPASVAV